MLATEWHLHEVLRKALAEYGSKNCSFKNKHQLLAPETLLVEYTVKWTKKPFILLSNFEQADLFAAKYFIELTTYFAFL